jgi:hypothetical protein
MLLQSGCLGIAVIRLDADTCTLYVLLKIARVVGVGAAGVGTKHLVSDTYASTPTTHLVRVVLLLPPLWLLYRQTQIRRQVANLPVLLSVATSAAKCSSLLLSVATSAAKCSSLLLRSLWVTGQ